MVSRAVNRLWPHNNWQHDTVNCSLCRVPTRTADVVGLGDSRGGSLYDRCGRYHACLRRTALQYVQADNQPRNQESDPCDGPGKPNSGKTSL